VLRSVAQLRRATGHRVVALAAAGETAQRFGREVGAHDAMTIDGFIRRAASGRLAPAKYAVLVDEAGLLEDWRWLGLLRATGGTALTVTGDSAQLSPIEAGGLFTVIAKRLGATTLTENFRARDAWAGDTWSDLREGRALRAVARLERKRRITLSPTRAESRDAAVERWDQDRREGATRGRDIDQFLLVADSSNGDVDRLNAAAQQRRHRAGELGGLSMEVRTTREDGGLRVERLYAGDSVSFTRQVYFGPSQRRVENGTSGVVARIHIDANAVDVELADRSVTIRNDDLMALRLGYAQHVYAAQGRTVDRVYVVTGGWQTARETSYVGVSRAREASFLYTDYSSLDMEVRNRKAALRELVARASESRAKVSALGWHEHREERRARQRADFAAAGGTEEKRAAAVAPSSRSATERTVAGRGAAGRDAALEETERRREATEQRRAWEIQRD
jgi:ATP-dependent exoDNAse (exonuclease V) alpha subunit